MTLKKFNKVYVSILIFSLFISLSSHAELNDETINPTEHYLVPFESKEDGSDKLMDNKAFQYGTYLSLGFLFAHVVFQAKEDKQQHALAGSIASIGGAKFCEYYLIIKEESRLKCALAGAATALLAGIAKEAYDLTGRGSVDAMDAVYSFVPGALISFSIMF